MSLTTGVLSKIAVGQTTDTVSSTAATSGSTPYAYQWYRSTTTNFVPGAGNIVSGATSLGLSDTGLNGGTTYYYKVVTIDAAAASVTSTQLAVITAPVQSQNQFSQTDLLGALDLPYNYNTVSVQIDTTSAGGLIAGQAVKCVDSSGGVPKVVECAANSDEVMGFINYDVKSRTFGVGDTAEISMLGNVMYLISVGAIARLAQVQLDLTYVGGVKTITGSSGADVVGFALDKATADGQLIRVQIRTPSYTKA